MKILAFDPGKTTGWCQVDTAGGTILGGSFPTWEEVPRLIAQSPDLVIIESFRLYPWSASRLRWDDIKAAQVLGVIMAECQWSSVEYITQSARVKVILSTKPKGFDRHACDAFSHILAFLKREKLLTEELKTYIKEKP